MLTNCTEISNSLTFVTFRVIFSQRVIGFGTDYLVMLTYVRFPRSRNVGNVNFKHILSSL